MADAPVASSAPSPAGPATARPIARPAAAPEQTIPLPQAAVSPSATGQLQGEPQAVPQAPPQAHVQTPLQAQAPLQPQETIAQVGPPEHAMARPPVQAQAFLRSAMSLEPLPTQSAPHAPSTPSAVGEAHAVASQAADAAAVAADVPLPGGRSQASARAEAIRPPSTSAFGELAAAADRIAAADHPPQDSGGSPNRDARQTAAQTPLEVVSTPQQVGLAAATVVAGVPPAEMIARLTVQAPTADAPMTPSQSNENAARLVESMRVQWRQGVPEATVKLHPEHLGEVTISVRVERGHVAAVVHAESAAVQQWLEAQEGRMRSGLAQQGLTLERFVVQRDRQEQRRDGRQSPPARYRTPELTGQRFEITV